MNQNNAYPSYVIALGEYEKQVILELDKLQAYKEAHLYKTRQDASLLFLIIRCSWESKASVQDCLQGIHYTSLLLLRGIQPAFDAVAILTEIKPIEPLLIFDVLK